MSDFPKWQVSRWPAGSMYYVPELEGFNTEEKRLNTNVANEDGQNRTDEPVSYTHLTLPTTPYV